MSVVTREHRQRDVVTLPAAATIENDSVLSTLASLAEASASRHDFLRSALEHTARTFGSPFATVYAQYPSEVVREEFHTGPSDPAFWRDAVTEFLTNTLSDGQSRIRLFGARDASLQIGVMAAPLALAEGGRVGGAALVCRMTRDTAQRFITHFEALVTLTCHLADTIGTRRDRGYCSRTVADPSPGQWSQRRLAGGFGLLGRQQSAEETGVRTGRTRDGARSASAVDGDFRNR